MLMAATTMMVAGCASPVPARSPLADGPHRVASPLEAFWSANGGLGTFGPPLEEARVEGSLLRQTFLNAEMILDPSLPESSRVYLAPLGLQLGLAEPPVAPTGGSETRYIQDTGHFLYPGFALFYDRMDGSRLAGPPIGEVRFRDGWVVQPFRNLGLIRAESAPPSEVRWLSYGLAARPDLTPQVARESAFLPPGLHARPFAAMIDRLGGESVIGPPLTDPFLSADGSLEQVYERAVLFSPLESPAQVRLRALGSALGPADPAVLDAAEGFDLYAPQTGHNIAWAFAAFYTAHGGASTLGLPLEEAVLTGGVLRQRYESVVLEYHFDLPPLLAVQLAPLGAGYLLQLPAQPMGGPAAEATSLLPSTPFSLEPAYRVTTLATFPVLRVGATQEITVTVASTEGDPVGGVVPLVVIHTARADIYPAFPPTDASGISRLALPLADIQPGEIVNFEVFIAGDAGVGHALGQFVVGSGSPLP